MDSDTTQERMAGATSSADHGDAQHRPGGVDHQLVDQVVEMIQFILQEAGKACHESTMNQALILIDHRRRIELLEGRIIGVRQELLRCAHTMRELDAQLQQQRNEYSADELQLAREFLAMFSRCLKWTEIDH